MAIFFLQTRKPLLSPCESQNSSVAWVLFVQHCMYCHLLLPGRYVSRWSTAGPGHLWCSRCSQDVTASCWHEPDLEAALGAAATPHYPVEAPTW